MMFAKVLAVVSRDHNECILEITAFSELIKDGQSVMEVICSLLAVLEVIKSRLVVVMQNRMFGDIRICRRENSGLQ